MTVYVDFPIWARAGVKNPRTLYAHMVANSLKELHEFAITIGVKKHFFHKSPSAHHYDITEKQYEAAMKAGAQQVTSKELLKIGKKATQEKLI